MESIDENKAFEKLMLLPEFSNLKTLLDEQARLSYQYNHLEKEIDEILNNNPICIQKSLEAMFDRAVKKVIGSEIKHEIQLNIPNKSSFGDYQCNSALRISKIDVAGPGFLNIWISKSCILNELKKVLVNGPKPPFIEQKHSVVIDMSSPNIAKEMHVGHLRSTIIGESISRLLKFMGHSVLKLNHIGDWGTQFGMLIAHMNEMFSNSDTAPPISDLQKFYKSAKIRFDNEEDFKQKAYASVVKLQQKDPKYIKSWNQICDISRKEFENVYLRLGIENLIERGESFYQSRMDEMVEDLKNRKLLTYDDGRYLLWAPGNQIPLTIIKSDGGYTYDTSDLCALRQRIEEEKADTVLYVVDAGQSTHFDCLLSAAEFIGFYNPKLHNAKHINFGVVLGEDKKKFKTRSGESVRLVDLLDEGLERSRKRLIEKGRDKELTEQEFEKTQKAVAYGCIKYADLSHHRVNDYIFSFDKMLDDKGNTAVYLIYAYIRIRSIIRSSGYSPQKLQECIRNESFNFDHVAEWNLAKFLCRFSDVLMKVQSDFLLHSLCDYLYELSTCFTAFYDACYCIERDRQTSAIVTIHSQRLLLCEATAQIMKCGLEILGLETLEKM